MAKEKLKVNVLAGTDIVQCSTASGGVLHEVTPDGEVVSEVYVPPGRHRASIFMVDIGRGHFLVPSENVLAYTPPVKTHVNNCGEMMHESAASQNFRVDRSDRERWRNDQLEKRLNAQERKLAIQERALERARGLNDEAEAAKADRAAKDKADQDAAAEAAAKAEAEAAAKAAVAAA